MLRSLRVLLAVLTVGFAVLSVSGQTTEFTYQGNIKDGDTPANGNYDLEFRLFGLPSGGGQIGITLQRMSVPVTDGIFSVRLDFGASALPGADRYLEISLRQSGVGAFVPLSPRQKVSSAPYSVRSLNSGSAEQATNAAQLGGVAAGQYVLTNDPRMTDARDPVAGSPNYIQNTAAQQAASNFNISGDGTAGGTLSGGVVNAGIQYNLSNSRFLHTAGTGTFLGINSGTGTSSVFVGRDAGAINTGTANTFLGYRAGQINTNGGSNTFVGFGAGIGNISGGGNTMIGASAGEANTGSDNVALGVSAGAGVIVNIGNTFLGARTDASNGLTNATAVGFRAKVAQNNSLVLGSINGENGATADTFVGIGTTAPARRLHVSNGPSGATSNASADVVIEDDASAFQHFLAPSGLESGILFGDPTASIRGGIVFNHPLTNGGIMFRTNGNTTRMVLDGSGNLGIGTQVPIDRLDVSGGIRFNNLAAGGGTPLCQNGLGQIASCVGSSLRYKTNITPFTDGMSFVRKLRPITFDWKMDGRNDIGFGAEDIAAIDPRFAVFGKDGEIEGVRYDRLGVAFVNAFKEQQQQIEKQQALIKNQQGAIETLQKQVDEQRGQIEKLLRIACSQTHEPGVCGQ